MMARTMKSAARPGAPAPSGAVAEAPLGGTRAEALRRLQMGALGVVAVLLLIGLASIIRDRAAQTETTSVAGAAATSPPATTTAAADPLAEAGVVPEMPVASTEGTASPGAATTTSAPGPGAR